MGILTTQGFASRALLQVLNITQQGRSTGHPIEKCVCVCVSHVAERSVTCLKLPNKLVTGKVDCPQPHAHTEGKNEEASHPLPICL